MKMDRIFLLPPSFFALVGGTFLTVAIDLIKTLLSAQETQTNYIRMMLLSISAIAISTGSFLFLSMKLEGLRAKFPRYELHEAGIRGKDKRGKQTDWRQLWYAFLIGFFFVCLGFASLALGYFVFRNQGVVDC
jgi:ABC-type Fe3+ transport system permease subunit